MIEKLSGLEGVDELIWKRKKKNNNFFFYFKCKMATSRYCKIDVEKWKECSAEPDGSSHLNDWTV